ncbi:hypothetical protein ACFZB6_29910 [Streptomyces syringium]|uniref:hypothetical protein n=1 Tax=Streptomyces syringium TaxID=76729 RepID=UPI0036EEF7D3
MTEEQTDHSLAWIGHHADDTRETVDGMLGSISLTAIRSTDPVDFLVRMGADRDVLARGVLYKDIAAQWSEGDFKDRLCMFGTSGEWTFLLENFLCATWYLDWIEGVQDAKPRPGEELVCVTLNHHQSPSKLLYSPGDGEVWSIGIGEESLLDYPDRDDSTGKVAALDEALRRAGVVWQGDDLLPRTFQTVGEHLGIRLPREEIEAGLLPAAGLPDPAQ